ncbi:hypothetical protein EMGBS15_10470 [Filimonas sp.]|nr:hypothetical protein EMGBS15_10470 [Filimonas sp.]
MYPPGAYVLVGNAAKMMCATCDYKSLAAMFPLNGSGFGTGTGLYANTIFLNTDLAINGGCGCLTGSGNYNNGSGTGDRIMLMNDTGTVIDAMLYAGGNNYGNGPINVNFVGTTSCSVNSAVLPAVSDPMYNGRKICNDLSGCNSSFARLPDGNNGVIVTYDQSGNLSCTNCLVPCASGAVNTASTDYPTPGLNNSNSASTWNATLNGAPVNASTTTMTVCGATPLTFTYQIINFTNASLVATQPSGNLGSYLLTNGGIPTNFTGTTYNVVTVSLPYQPLLRPLTAPPPTNLSGAMAMSFVPLVRVPILPRHLLLPHTTEQECYVSRTLIVTRENALGGRTYSLMFFTRNHYSQWGNRYEYPIYLTEAIGCFWSFCYHHRSAKRQYHGGNHRR